MYRSDMDPGRTSQGGSYAGLPTLRQRELVAGGSNPLCASVAIHAKVGREPAPWRAQPGWVGGPGRAVVIAMKRNLGRWSEL